MVRLNAGESNPDEIERIARAADVVRNGWQRTIDEVRSMADAREEEGYDTLTVFAVDTAPVAPDAGQNDYWGLSYLIGSDDAETVSAFDERTDFDETAVYQNQMQGNVFIATECIDLDAEAILLIAGAYRMRQAPDLVRTATDEGRMFSHIRQGDGTVVASVEHADAESFFPEPEKFYAYEVTGTPADTLPDEAIEADAADGDGGDADDAAADGTDGDSADDPADDS
ncbi:MAG: hypothetical protein ABEJ05_08995 [Haloglomus sp.]